MGAPFRAVGAGVRVGLHPQERALVATLLGEVAGMLDDGRSAGNDPLAELVGLDAATLEPGWTDDGPPDDPALARLLPQAHRNDPELASEFRRLTEYGLRGRKRAALDSASAALGRSDPLVLTTGEGLSLLKGLTDIRLVIAERLGLRTDDDAERLHEAVDQGDPGDPWVAMAALYDALSAWQESLVGALSR